MKLFLDDIKRITWLKEEIEAQSWGKVFLTLPKGFYFVFYYNLIESESKIEVVLAKSLYEINEGIYRGMPAQHIGYIKDPFDTTGYILFSLLKSACRTQESISKLNDLFFSYKIKDLEQYKANLKIRIIGSQQINSAISFNTALNNIFEENNKPVHGLCMIYELIDNYAKNVKGKSIYGQLLTKIVKAVKNPNGGLVPEYPNTTMRYLIVGEKAASTNPEMMESLEKAKQLYRSSNSPYSVYLETGWYFNKYDLKWRKRISDDSFFFQMDKISTENGGYQFTPEGFKNLTNDVNGIVNGDGIEKLIVKGYDGKLGDYISFEEAFKLYPNLPDIFSVFSVNVIDNGYSFYFTPTPKSLILISSKQKNKEYDIDKIKYVALHEMQHFVQNEEGFDNGGNLSFASLIDAVGGSSFRNFYNSLFAFQKKFEEVCITIPQQDFDSLIGGLISLNTNISLDSLAKICETKESIVSNSSTITYYLVSIYSLNDRTNGIIENFVNKYFDSSYLDLFKLALQQNRKALERDKQLTSRGWTKKDLYSLNFQTYQSLLGEIESRFVQQTSKIPKELQDYFEFYTSETIDPSKIAVYNDSAYLDEGKKAKAGIETTNDGKYIIHLPNSFSDTIDLLHETGHILYDFLKDDILSNVDMITKSVELGKDIEEYFCESFVDYIHRKDIDAALTRDISFGRSIENYTDFDDIISDILYYQSSIDESGLILRLSFVEKLLAN
jgi:hypothetical protein